MKKLAIIITHPIQYYSPLFRKLAQAGQINLKVFYTWSQAQIKKFDEGFGKEIEWDIPLLEGYDFTFVENISKKPGSNHYKGIINPSLNKEIVDWKADFLLIIGWNLHSHLKAMQYFKGIIPVYFRGDSTLLDEKQGVKKLMRRIYLRSIYKNIDYAFYVGQRNKEYFLVHGLKDEQLIFAPHTVENERFYDEDKSYKQKALEWRRAIGIKDNDFVFLFAGKLEPKKNPILLLKAFISLEHPKAHLIFVGNGILENELKNYVTLHPEAGQSNGQNSLLRKNIHFLDFQNQSKMPIVYRLGNVFVLPSQSETWGLSVNEAMACSLPILLSHKVGCAVDLIKIGLNGFIFESQNIDDLIQQMSLILETWIKDKNRLNIMGINSLNIISDYSIGKFANSIINSI